MPPATFRSCPKAQHDLPHWQDAIEHLMQASGSPAWLMFARMFLKAPNHGVERVFNTDRKETHWVGLAEAEADQ